MGIVHFTTQIASMFSAMSKMTSCSMLSATVHGVRPYIMLCQLPGPTVKFWPVQTGLLHVLRSAKTVSFRPNTFRPNTLM